MALKLLRGERFAGDHAGICMYIGRNKNENIVAYELLGGPAAVTTADDEPALPAKDALHAFWLDIDPAYVTKARAKGKQDDRVELNLFERNMAWGVTTAAGDGGTQTVTFTALSKRTFTLRMLRVAVDGAGTQAWRPAVCGEVDGHPAVLERVWAQAVEGAFLPRLEYIDIHAHRCDTGEPVVERVLNK